MPRPSLGRLIQLDFDPSHRRDRPPSMPIELIERERPSIKSLGVHPDGAAQGSWPRRGALIDATHEPVALPGHLGRADHQLFGPALNPLRRVLTHHPSLSVTTAQHHVERWKLERVHARAPSSLAGVGWREHTPQEYDRGQAVSAIVGEGIDVPPGVAIGREVDVKSRSSAMAWAASRPLSATIGTPAPGCALAPAM